MSVAQPKLPGKFIAIESSYNRTWDFCRFEMPPKTVEWQDLGEVKPEFEEDSATCPKRPNVDAVHRFELTLTGLAGEWRTADYKEEPPKITTGKYTEATLKTTFVGSARWIDSEECEVGNCGDFEPVAIMRRFATCDDCDSNNYAEEMRIVVDDAVF